MKLTILLNPAAGRGRARWVLGEALEVLRRAGVEPQVQESQSAEHLVELARHACRERPDILVSAGGDGTHHLVLNGLFGSEVPLGLIPGGKGNDLAKGLGVPLEPRAAAAVLLAGRTRQVDVARVGAKVYNCVAGVGFDCMVARLVNERVRWAGGRFAYTWAILRCLKAYRPQPIELSSDRQDFSGDIFFAVVGNNVSYGGGIKLTPRALPDDGWLDVCIVPALGKLELLRWLPRAYRGEHLTHPRIIYFRARRITLASSSPLELFGDGEFMQKLPATIEVIPRALWVMVPA